jgi:hypothetical protein
MARMTRHIAYDVRGSAIAVRIALRPKFDAVPGNDRRRGHGVA